jgi:hypothetical protein
VALIEIVPVELVTSANAKEVPDKPESVTAVALTLQVPLIPIESALLKNGFEIGSLKTTEGIAPAERFQVKDVLEE